MKHYRVDTRNLGFAELWRISKLGFPVLVLLKIARIPLPLRMAVPFPPPVVRLDDSELDTDGRRARLQGLFDALEGARFSYQFLYRTAIISPDTTSTAAAFLSEDGWSYAVAIEAVTRIGAKTRRTTRLSLVTPLADGHFLATVNHRDMDSQPSSRGRWSGEAPTG